MKVSVRKQPPWLQALLILPGVAALVVTFVFPLLWLARTSLEPTTGHTLSLHAYVRLFEDSFYWWVIGRTIVIGLLCVVITVPMAFPVALFLARSQSRWRGTLTALAIAPLLTSTVIRTYGWMVILGRHGLINTTLLWAHILAQPTRLDNGPFATVVALVEILLPYGIISILSHLSRLDAELEQAASLLGARRLQVFWRVLLPLSLPGLMTASLLVFVLAISSLVTPQLMGGGRVFVLATEIFNQTTIALDWPFAGALSITLLAFFGIFVALYQRILQHVESQS